MKFRSEIALYDYQKIASKFTAHDTQFNVVQGKINAICSEEQITTLINGDKTLYSKLSDVEITVDGIRTQVSDVETQVLGDQVNSVVSRLSTVEQTASGIRSTVSEIQTKGVTVDNIASVITQKAGSVNISVFKNNSGYATQTEVNNKLSEYTKTAELEISINGIKTKVTSANIDLNGTKNAAITAANNATDSKLDNYTKTTNLISYINQQSDSINLGVIANSSTLATKTYASDQATAAKNAANTATDNKLKSYTKTADLKITIDGIQTKVTEASIDLTGTKNAAITAANNNTTNQLKNYTKSTELVSYINQQAGKIELKVVNGLSGMSSGSTFQQALKSNARWIRLTETAISWDASNSSMTEEGFLTCTGGNIAGWEITSTRISGSTNDYYVAMCKPTSNTAYIWWVRNTNDKSDPFYVKADGSLVATKATITGKITASSGSIGGWTINAKSISREITDGSLKYTTAINAAGSTISGKVFYVSKNNSGTVTNPFYVQADGYLYAETGVFGGSLSAATGTFKGSLSAAIGTFNGAVTSASGTNKVVVDEARIMFTRTGTNLGQIGTNNTSDNSNYKGIVFDLNATGYYMSWSSKKSSSENVYTHRFVYANKSFSGYSADTFTMNATLDMNGNSIKNFKVNGKAPLHNSDEIVHIPCETGGHFRAKIINGILIKV